MIFVWNEWELKNSLSEWKYRWKATGIELAAYAGTPDRNRVYVTPQT